MIPDRMIPTRREMFNYFWPQFGWADRAWLCWMLGVGQLRYWLDCAWLGIVTALDFGLFYGAVLAAFGLAFVFFPFMLTGALLAAACRSDDGFWG